MLFSKFTRIHMSKAVAERLRGLFRYSLKLTPTMTKGVAQPADTSENNAKSRWTKKRAPKMNTVDKAGIIAEIASQSLT